GEARARAIGAYSMILAAGVAAGQILGGLVVSMHLIAAAWRPALLLNAPVGIVLLLVARRGLPAREKQVRRRLDFGGVAVLTAAALALVVPLTFGRDAGWPAWVWPSFAFSLLALAGFAAVERGVTERGGHPLLDLDLLRSTGIAAGVLAVALLMGCYSGFLLSLTLHLQNGLGFGPLHAGLIFAVYASGFATASLTWTRAGTAVRDRLPVAGPLVMASALLAVGLVANGGGWPAAATLPLLFAGGVGHAWGFSPLASRMTARVRTGQAADMSGLVLTASLVGNVLGTAGFVGIYLAHAPSGSAHALEVTTIAIAAALAFTAVCGFRALAPARHACGAKAEMVRT
ncbi:MAG TPA: MFS transporter, partial [Candidatus Dormibacteraeota bacterium]|nr:MFS transporter [Candidatus Dormibacteraeota bacterium]